MSPVDIITIDSVLGAWEKGIPLSEYALALRLEQSDNDLSMNLANPDKDIILFARPGGFQLASHYGSEMRTDFALAHASITSIRLLPSFTVEKKQKLRLGYILVSVCICMGTGVLTNAQPYMLLWICLGVNFGITLSLFSRKMYRQNLLMLIMEGGNEYSLLFSMDKKVRDKCLAFFENFAPNKFVH
jgi:hypothetical protein